MTIRKPFAHATLAALAAIGLSLPAQAQIVESQTSTVSSWAGTPAFETGSAPTTGSGGTTADNDSWGGNANGTAGFGALAEAFEVTSTGTLTSAQLVTSGGTATFNVELYNLGPASGFPGYQAAPGNPATISQINSVGGVNSPNLLAAGDQATYTASAGNELVTLTFGGADASVQLLSGNIYVLSLDPTANADGTWWLRGGVPVAGFNTGEGLNADGVNGLGVFEGKTSVRDLDLAVNVTSVPEPSTIALGVIGASSFLFRRRSK
jgi:hypothetical protein